LHGGDGEQATLPHSRSAWNSELEMSHGHRQGNDDAPLRYANNLNAESDALHGSAPPDLLITRGLAGRQGQRRASLTDIEGLAEVE